MNSIENLWNILKVKVEKRKPKNINKFKKCVEDEWNKTNVEVYK